jgi:hypothetical protein
MVSMQQDKNVTIEELTWQDVADRVKKVNFELYEIIEQLKPNKKLTLYRVRYPYGTKIIDNGKLNLITKAGEIIPISDERIPQAIREALGYRSIPLGLVLKNSSEVCVEDSQHIIPLRLLSEGNLFGVFETLDPASHESSSAVTNLFAGARSAFMLAKISDTASHKRAVKEFELHAPLPKGLADHGTVFAEIGSHQRFKGKWENEILFFSQEWFKERNENAGWLRFIKYLHEIGWQQSQYWRTQTIFGFSWKPLINAISDKNIRPRPYIVDTIKHLIFMSTGTIPGFAPAGLDEKALPTKIIQDVYLNFYNLKSHSPIIMIPSHFIPGDSERSAYYSLSYPTLLEASFNPKQSSTMIEDMREIKLIMTSLQNRLQIDFDPMFDFIKKIHFEYFTCETDIQGKITPSTELPKLDKTFLNHEDNEEERTFPALSTFLRGCIRISNKK